MTEWREFRPQSKLLQSNFDGYRLSLDPLAQYSIQFDDSIQVQKEVEIDEDRYTLNSIKAFKSNNELYLNPWKNEPELYFFDRSYAVQQIRIPSNESLSHLPAPLQVYQLPNHSLHGSMSFVSNAIVLLCDGRSKLSILDTTTTSKWKLIHDEDFDEYVDPPIRLVHAVHHENTIDAVIGSLKANECQFLWVTFTVDGSNSWKLARRRVLMGKVWPDMLTLESTGQGLYLVAEREYKFTFDSSIEVKPEEPSDPPVVQTIESPLTYLWSQTTGTIEIEIDCLTDETASGQWTVQFEAEHLKCSVNETVLFDGKLVGKIDPKESSYSVIKDKNHQLSITLQKVDAGFFWNDVFKEGRAIAGHADTRSLPETKELPDNEEIQQPYNSQQLEECDQYATENETFVYRFHGDTHQVTHQGLVPNQILFTRLQPPSICIRHDVDGLIWQLHSITTDDTIAWSHEATLNAFGYVQASKQNRKFISTPEDHSYALIADMRTHLYLYKQQSPTSNLPGSTLRNRKTGKAVETIGKQYLISLENHEEILGLSTTSERIYVLLGNQFYIIAI